MDIHELIRSNEPESETLEYKDKRADNRSVTKELVAFANTNGGQLILGIQEKEDEITGIQSIEDTSTREEGIQNVIKSSVEPRLKVSFSRESVDDNQLLSMCVEPGRTLRSFEINNKPSFPVRQGSSTDYLHGMELEQRYRRSEPTPDRDNSTDANADSQWDFSAAPSSIVGVARSGSVPDLEPISPPQYSAPANRVITETARHTIVIPGRTRIDPFGLGAVTFQLQGRLAVSTTAELETALQEIGTQLGAAVADQGQYAIYFNERQLIGRHASNFLVDSRRITEIVARLDPGSGTPSDPRPVGVFIVPTQGGLFWLQVQWKDGQLRSTRIRCGLVLPNLPFNDQAIRQYFGQILRAPEEYEQDSRIQHLHCNAHYELTESEPVHLWSEREEIHTQVVGENPFYQRPDAVAESFESPIPTHFTEALAGVNRIAYDVAGGWMEDDAGFVVSDMEIFAFDTMFPVYVVDAFTDATQYGD